MPMAAMTSLAREVNRHPEGTQCEAGRLGPMQELRAQPEIVAGVFEEKAGRSVSAFTSWSRPELQL